MAAEAACNDNVGGRVPDAELTMLHAALQRTGRQVQLALKFLY